jgi:putative ATP-dependent endonuclease of OLD family
VVGFSHPLLRENVEESGTRIQSIEVRRFRSIEKTILTNCGGLNVLIGKNNAGKSNILSTIDLMHRHLSGAAIAGPWNTPRPADEFTDRNCEAPLQIGIEFEFPSYLNLALREWLQSEAPHLEKSIDQIKGYSRLTFALAGA